MVSVSQEFFCQFRASIFGECIKFIFNLLCINNWSVFFETYIIVHFFQITFFYLELSRACIILLFLITPLSLGNICHRATKSSLKKLAYAFLTCFDVTPTYILRFEVNQLYGILGNNAFKKILQFFLGIECHRKVS